MDAIGAVHVPMSAGLQCVPCMQGTMAKEVALEIAVSIIVSGVLAVHVVIVRLQQQQELCLRLAVSPSSRVRRYYCPRPTIGIISSHFSP